MRQSKFTEGAPVQRVPSKQCRVSADGGPLPLAAQGHGQIGVNRVPWDVGQPAPGHSSFFDEGDSWRGFYSCSAI